MNKTSLGQELIAGLKEVVEHTRGAKKLRASTMEIPDRAPHWRKERIARIRKEIFHVSQPVFAQILSVTPSTVRAWEQGRKSPSGAASRLLELANFQPDIFQRLAQEHAR